MASRGPASRLRRLLGWVPDDWDDVIAPVEELLEGVHRFIVFAIVGFGVGFGAGVLLGVAPWALAVPSALIVPLAVVLLLRAVEREDERNRMP